MLHPIGPLLPRDPLGHRRPTIGFLTALLRDQYSTVTWSGVMDVARERDVNVLNLVGSRLGSPPPSKRPRR